MNFAAMDGSFAAWRDRARDFLRRGIPPREIQWSELGKGNLFQDSPENPSPAPSSPAKEIRVPKFFLELAQAVACYRDPKRWPLLYEALWRLNRGEPRLLSIVVDPTVSELLRMQKAIRRDVHKMKAFVRFRELVQGEGSIFVAWYEPDHLIVERAAPFFARRFGDQSWMILTPDRSASWEAREARLSFHPGVVRGDAEPLLREDGVEDLWKRYYASIFNPARVKVKAMKAEMPVHFWRNLPEADLIKGLLREARGRVESFGEGEGAAKDSSQE